MAKMASRTGSSSPSADNKRRRIDRSDAKVVAGDELCLSGSDGELLSASALKSVRLWAAAAPGPAAAAGSTSSTNKTQSAPRSPADVARLRFFDVPRVDAIDVEGHILTALILRCDEMSRVVANATAAGLKRCPSSDLPQPTPSVQSRLREFECWPTPQDWEHIRGVIRLTGIDMLKTPFLAAAEWNKVEDCLGKGGGGRLWRNRVLAASLSVRMRAREQGQQRASANAAGVLGDLPEDILGDILAFAGFSSVKTFSAASSKCRDLVRRHPQFRGSWRRSLFYAKAAAANSFDVRDWKVLCAEDVPDASLAPDPLLSAFRSLETRSSRGGLCSWQHADSRVSSQSLKEGAIMRNTDFGSEGRALRSSNLIWTDNKVLFPDEEGATFSFFCRSPFGPSSTPSAVLGYSSTQQGSMPGHAVMALVGYDGFGGFIGAGRGWFAKNVTGMHNLKFCCRYLPPGDERLGWSVDCILSSLRSSQGFCEKLPWKSALFNLDYASEPPLITSPILSLKPAMPAIPGFKLHLRLICDLRGFATQECIAEAKHRREEVDSNCCIECNNNVGNASMVQCHDDEVIGLKDLLYQLHEQDLPFCNKECFLEFMTAFHSVDCISNVIWKDQCWGCGSVGEACLPCYIRNYHDGDEDEPAWGFLNFDDPVKFCSSKCALATLPIILKACKEYRSHDLSRGARKLLLFTDGCENYKSFTDVFGKGDEGVEMLTRDGWKNIDDDWILEDPSKAADDQQSTMGSLSLG